MWFVKCDRCHQQASSDGNLPTSSLINAAALSSRTSHRRDLCNQCFTVVKNVFMETLPKEAPRG